MCRFPYAAIVSARWSSANKNRTFGRSAAARGDANMYDATQSNMPEYFFTTE
jgi:hypothetical protein